MPFFMRFMCLPAACEYISNVHGLQGNILFTDITTKLHEATKVGRDDAVSSGGKRVIDLLVGHTNRYRRELYREGAAKATAGFIVNHLHQFQSLHILQQPAWAFLDPTFAQGSTTVV